MSQTNPANQPRYNTTDDHEPLPSRRTFLNTGSSLLVGTFASQLVSCVGRAESGPANSSGREPDIIFVRHAETIANATGRYSSGTVNTFTAAGKRQTSELAGKLQPLKPVRVICSPIERCRKTIGPYLRKERLTAEIWPELAECCWQKNRGAAVNPSSLRRAETISLRADEKALFRFSNPDDQRRWSISTYGQGLGMISLLETRLKKEAQKTNGPILVIGHSISGSILLGKLTGGNGTRPAIKVNNATPMLLMGNSGGGAASHRLLPRKG